MCRCRRLRPRRSSSRQRRRRSLLRQNWTWLTGDQATAAELPASSRTAATGSVRRCPRPTQTALRRGSLRHSLVKRPPATASFPARPPSAPPTRLPTAFIHSSVFPPPIIQILQVSALSLSNCLIQSTASEYF